MIIRHDKMNEAEAPAGGGGADAAVIANAAEAVAQAKAAVAQAEAQKAALEQRLAALEAKPAVLAPVAPEGLDEVKRFMVKTRDAKRLDTIKAMGLQTKTDDGRVIITDEQVLAMIPNVDPTEPDGIAKLEVFRQSNSGLFKQQGQTQQSYVEAVRPQLEELSKKSGLFDAGKLTRSVFGGS
jgi:hypothetical protein